MPINLFDECREVNNNLTVSNIVEKADNDINNPLSAFAVRENEIAVFDGCESRKYDYVIFQVNKGIINELCFDILDVLNEFVYLTSRQITLILNLRGKEVTQRNVQNKLKILTKGKVVARYYFKSDEGQSTMRMYTLDINGSRLLKDREKTSTWNKGILLKPIYVQKRMLMRNQIIISFMLKTQSFKNYSLAPKYKSPTYKRTVEGDVLITISSDNEEYDFLFLVSRRYGWVKNEDKPVEWQKKDGASILLLSDFIKNYDMTKTNKKPPFLMLCGEDLIHIRELEELIKYNNIQYNYKSKPLYFYTYDNMLLKDALNESFSRIDDNEVRWQCINMFSK